MWSPASQHCDSVMQNRRLVGQMGRRAQPPKLHQGPVKKGHCFLCSVALVTRRLTRTGVCRDWGAGVPNGGGAGVPNAGAGAWWAAGVRLSVLLHGSIQQGVPVHQRFWQMTWRVGQQAVCLTFRPFPRTSIVLNKSAFSQGALLWGCAGSCLDSPCGVLQTEKSVRVVVRH